MTESAPAVYVLPPADKRPVDQDRVDALLRQRERELLRYNAEWFCRLRWLVVIALTAAGLGALVTDNWSLFGLSIGPGWTLTVAIVLAIANLGFLAWLRRLGKEISWQQSKAVIWFQIAFDLAVLTVVIHHMGCLSTFAPFMYLGHIVLSCIFFRPTESLIVLLVSIVSYVALVGLEASGAVPPASLFAGAAIPDDENVIAWQTAFTCFLWISIWYLASRLSDTLHRRDQELAAANIRLEAGSRERMRHMLQTTHQLKAPFAAIHANTQLLLDGYCGVLPERAARITEKIAQRCAFMSQQIQSMLQLANLRSEAQLPPAPERLRLDQLIETLIRRIEPTAQQRGIAFETDLRPVEITVPKDYITMIVDNLLTNAVNYSHDGDTVHVSLQTASDDQVTFMVRDHGIGIPADKLPHVFDDYYRTDEAARHCRLSTGLGLAVVRDAARACDIGVRIESAPGWGTRVWLDIPIHSPRTSSPPLPNNETTTAQAN
ncbi:hypothetical protein JCM19992_23510 [Thermostilla marina]